MKASVFRIGLLVTAFLMLAVCSGCGSVATKNDLKSLQNEVNVLTLSNHDLEQRVRALEEMIGDGLPATPAPAEPEPAEPAPKEPTPAPEIPSSMLTADDICSRMMKGGMPISSFVRYSASDDPDGLLGAPGGYVSRSDFFDSTMPAYVKGIVEVFSSENDALAYKTELKASIEGGEIPEEHIYQYQNVLLRLPQEFAREQTLQYDNALLKVVSNG